MKKFYWWFSGWVIYCRCLLSRHKSTLTLGNSKGLVAAPSQKRLIMMGGSDIVLNFLKSSADLLGEMHAE